MVQRGGALLLVAVLAGCARPQGPLSPDEEITRAVLALLASDGLSVCVDRDTDGDSLSVFGQMAAAPAAARAHLRWYPPLPLRPEQRVTLSKLRGLQVESTDARLNEPEVRDDPLPPPAQFALNRAATLLAARHGTPVSIAPGWVPARVTAGWWIVNQFSSSCWPQFRLSAPVRARDVAFVTVRADHWGALYALAPQGRGWKPIAEWSRWLY